MPSTSWGGLGTSTTRYSDGTIYFDGAALPSGRAMWNGSGAVLITALTTYVSGRSAARTVYLQLGSAATGQFGVAASSSAQGLGWVACTNWLVAGGTARFHIVSVNGTVYFGTGGGGTTFNDNGTSWAGGLYGACAYVQAPAAPAAPTATVLGPTSIRMTWTAPDNGETAINGYYIQCAPTAAFGTGTLTYNVGVVGTYDFTGLTPGTTYFCRVAAKNAVTDAAGTVGAPSSYTSTKTLSGAFVGDGTNWNAGIVSVGDGTNWPNAEVFIGDGTTWKPAG